MTQTNNGSFKRKLIATAILAPMMAIVGCSDNDGSTTPPPVVETPTGTTEGFAYDGYLVGATVCVDENLNKQCDTGEPTATTVEGGKFNLEGLTDAQLLTPLVLQANANTIDLDTGLPADPNLKFLAPAGSQAISGFSTVIQMKVESALATGSTATLAELKAAASAELATELGVDGLDLTTFDPIAAKDSAATSQEQRTAAKLHLINQVLSEQIATLVPAAEANANGDTTAAFGALVNNLDVVDVKEAVDTDTAGLALNELKTATTDSVVTASEPVAPTTAEIEAQAAEDAVAQEEIQQAVETEEPTEPTGATGATGGTGTA